MPQLHTRDPYAGWRELTLRGMILGALITVVFTASNVYLGLKVGLTFATSIPAAVISMAVLKFFKGSNILENNMVQTQASAAGTLSTIIFVLPGLLMAGYWNGFPFWQTTLLCVSGGILGVIFTVPLRYAMVVKSSLPYPEGVAAAEILKVGSGEHEDAEQGQSGDSGVREILSGGLLAGLMSFLSGGLRVISDSASYWFKAGNAIFQLPMGFSLALLGAGYLVGLTGGIAILVGIFIAWGGAVPYFSNIIPQPSDMDMTASAERTEQDLSPKSMILIVLGMMLLLGFSFYHFIAAAQMSAGIAWTLVVVCTLLTSVIGFLVAAACGYMAGLVGSSASPISGIGIVSIVVISLVLLAVGESSGLFADEGNRQFMLALTLFCGSAVICVASISNDNLQDLKTGYLVKATPRLQQIALIIGCVAGAIVVSPVLELLYEAYGFTGAMPRAGMDASQALAAPQATLMTTITQGIFAHNLQWNYIFTGVGIGVALIIVDFILKKSSGNRLALPVLAVGMGIYLPPSVNMPIVVGAFLAAWLKSRIRTRSGDAENSLKRADRTGTLFAAGLIVGESLIGVAMAFVIAVSVTNGGSDAPLALGLKNWDTAASWLGLAGFLLGMTVFARRILKAAR
ncbi:oligopeptide transporter, OPT family [Neisseria sp. oral taxon 014]|uniref:OPT family oligopeptide transporter n=1 Tax=Neisseria sp. oral taxon 014 TaxID=641148 RepID=UPI0003043303|nr:oligopeptide transporter, OPT family [Neisseria sp. oral taxon 014]